MFIYPLLSHGTPPCHDTLVSTLYWMDLRLTWLVLEVEEYTTGPTFGGGWSVHGDAEWRSHKTHPRYNHSTLRPRALLHSAGHTDGRAPRHQRGGPHMLIP